MNNIYFYLTVTSALYMEFILGQKQLQSTFQFLGFVNNSEFTSSINMKLTAKQCAAECTRNENCYSFDFCQENDSNTCHIHTKDRTNESTYENGLCKRFKLRQICKPGFTKPCQCPSNFGDERCKYKYDCQGLLVSQNTTTYRFWRLFSTNEWRELLCEMTVDNGGWIVFQRRVDGSTDFYRNWTQYETGFGDLSASFYMGNSQLHEIVKTGDYELRIELEDQASQRRYAAYTNFFLGGPETSYKLKISGYHGNADDGLNYHNDMKFSTFDNDNDIHESGNCAEDFRAAWWYLNCYRSNLNGVYGRHEGGMYWVPWQGFHESLKSTMMMVRKKIP